MAVAAIDRVRTQYNITSFKIETILQDSLGTGTPFWRGKLIIKQS